MKTIENLWNGKTEPSSTPEFKSQKIKALITQLDKQQKYFTDTLDRKQTERFEKLEAYRDELDCISREDAFIKGFSLGVKLIAEAFLLD